MKSLTLVNPDLIQDFENFEIKINPIQKFANGGVFDYFTLDASHINTYFEEDFKTVQRKRSKTATSMKIVAEQRKKMELIILEGRAIKEDILWSSLRYLERKEKIIKNTNISSLGIIL